MKRLVILIAWLSVISAATLSTVYADHEGESISVTVTASSISIFIFEFKLDYGVLDLGETLNQPLTQECPFATIEAFEVFNGGNVVEDFFITGGPTTSSTTSWSLAGTAGSDAYVHRFNAGGGSGAPCTFTDLVDGVPQSLATNVGNFGGSELVFLELDMPTANTTGSNEHGLPILITAVESSGP